jgi:phage gp29-like protein
VPPDLANGATAAPSLLLDQFGGPLRRDTRDPAWQPPADPLAGGAAQRAIGTIHREIPLSVTLTGWDVPSARAAKRDLVIGLFESPAQMWDAIILSDSRVAAGLASRLSILGRPVEFRLPRKYRDSALAKECLDAFVDAWPEMATEASLGEMQRWAIGMGFGPAQILWDTTGDYATPHPLPWHPRYTYFHWLYRCYVAITMDGQEPIIPGDGSWMLHAPHGEYRGWMRGAVGPISPWWLGRNFALRDWMRWSEKHGLPILKLKTPAVGDPYQQAIVRFSLANIGQEALIHLPQNPPPALSYDVELMEAKASDAHEGFRKLIAQCNEEITLTLLAQTLTSSMPAEGGSSYAAARVHAGVLQGMLEADARALSWTLYRQLARPFAAINFGNPDIAPRVVWDVTPFEDAATKAQAFLQLASAISAMRTAGFQVDPKSARRMIRNTIPGFDPGPLAAVDPIALASANAKAKADAGAAEEVKQESKGARADLGRISRLMSRIDPAVARLIGKRADAARARFVNEERDDGLREARAFIDEAHTARRYTP